MNEQQATHQKRKRGKGPRPRHIPQRTCVVCRGQAAKRGLVRIVRTPELRIEIDPSGRLNGRGAYLCDKPACWERAVSTDILGKALNVTLEQDVRDQIRTYANQHLESVTGTPGAGSEE
jgi:predicted RNA-binding protein YlxR (DUF448 family)